MSAFLSLVDNAMVLNVCARILLLIVVMGQSACAIEPAPQNLVKLTGNGWSVEISPGTLETVAVSSNHDRFTVSKPTIQTAVTGLKVEGNRAAWHLPEHQVTVDLALVQDELHTTFSAAEPGTFTWPIIEGEATGETALIWPRAEGAYVPLNNADWTEYLIEMTPWNTLEGLSMPFWGISSGGPSLTWIATNPYNNEIHFSRTEKGLRLRFTHEFPPNHAARHYGFVFRMGANESPVEPAQFYRAYLERTGQFVPMKEKLRDAPAAERLLGAPHVYLWGDALLSDKDIGNPKQPRNRVWKEFCGRLVAESAEPSSTVSGRIRTLMEPEKWKAVERLAKAEWADQYVTGQITDELSRLLTRPGFYEKSAWKAVTIPPDIRDRLSRDPAKLTPGELCEMNSLLLRAAYPDYLVPISNWGDGVSTKMLDRLQEAGFDRLRICLPGWEGIERKPEVAKRAADLGYLFGTYDSFHSIHDPKLRGTDATWATAQFDQKLFDTGAITRRDGTKYRGFKQSGYKLSPLAVRPYVEKRVKERMSRVPYNYYFVDCDGFGEVYDDYSPGHPATQQQDATARADRLRWISRTFGAVIGTEGGSCYAAPAVHVVEGIVTPVFGWDDKEMHDKNLSSQYFLGAYYPPDAPRVFFQQVPLKEKYEKLYYDPRFRLPLYQTVFHDSTVSTHHWSAGSWKFAETTRTVELTELLYQVPPMYHLNIKVFERQGKVMKKHLAQWSPLHKKLGFAQMTDFNWLSDDRLVQRTEFAGTIEILVNFSQNRYVVPGLTLEPGSFEAREVAGERIDRTKAIQGKLHRERSHQIP